LVSKAVTGNDFQNQNGMIFVDNEEKVQIAVPRAD
jgi:hypothetical protein